MTDVASRELRNNTRDLLLRVRDGETITITLDGLPVAHLVPVGPTQRWMKRDEFVRRILRHPADPGLGDDLRSLVPDTTDDLG